MRKLILFFFILTACQNGSDDLCTYFEGWAMTMPYRVTVGKQLSAKEKKQVSKIIQKTFQEVNFTFNNWNPNSEISRLNRLGANQAAPLSAELEKLLIFCGKLAEISGGRFDPTIGPLEKLWREYLRDKKAPPIDKLQTAIDAIGWKHISIKNGQFQKNNPNTSIDLCSVSKGLCIDWIVERLQKEGFTDLFVEWAGEIRTSGEHPEKRDWTVQVDPGLRVDGKPMSSLPLQNAAIATSGDYAQTGWTLPAEEAIDGQVHRYFHIIDPFTGQPLEKTNYSIAAAVVIAPTCVLADALATAAMLFPGRAEAEKWAQEVVELYPEVSFWILSYSK